MTKTKFAFCLFLAGLCGLAPAILPAQNTQQLVFTGLRSVASQGQFNAVQTDSSGNIYLLLDQKDGVRLLKTDPAATNILAQAQIGAAGDIGLALALDPTGNIYVTGTTTSSSLTATSGVAFPTRADTSTNSFIAKFDASLNPLFVTYTGSGRTAATSIAATTDAVFITGSTFSATLPVTPSGIIQSPASGSFQNGFVEKFNTTGTALLYATYLSALNGDTAPSAITADASDNAYIAGYTTSTGYPTLNALIPEILTTPSNSSSGFLTKLTPAGMASSSPPSSPAQASPPSP
jgi:trimeric autotransporter adhesin